MIEMEKNLSTLVIGSITINAGDTLNLERTSAATPLYIKDALGNGTTGRLFNSDGVTGSGFDAIGETVSWTPNNTKLEYTTTSAQHTMICMDTFLCNHKETHLN